MKLSFKFDEAASKEIFPWIRDNMANFDAMKLFMRSKREWDDGCVHMLTKHIIVSEDEAFNVMFKLCWADRCAVDEVDSVSKWALPWDAIQNIANRL